MQNIRGIFKTFLKKIIHTAMLVICQEMSRFHYFKLPVYSSRYCKCTSRQIGFHLVDFAGLEILVDLGTHKGLLI